MNQELNMLSKNQLIEMIKELREELKEGQGLTQDEYDELEEAMLKSEAVMEKSGRIDYGYGCGVYGAC